MLHLPELLSIGIVVSVCVQCGSAENASSKNSSKDRSICYYMRGRDEEYSDEEYTYLKDLYVCFDSPFWFSIAVSPKLVFSLRSASKAVEAMITIFSKVKS